MSQMCCICREEDNNLMNVCQCKGSVAWLHFDCLKQWIETSGRLRCEVCLQQYRGIEIICEPKTMLSFIARKPLIYTTVAVLLLFFYIISFCLCFYSSKSVDHFLAIGLTIGNTIGFGYSIVYLGFKEFVDWKHSQSGYKIKAIKVK